MGGDKVPPLGEWEEGREEGQGKVRGQWASEEVKGEVGEYKVK